MKKLKLLIASCALLLGGMTVSAETNYTSLMPSDWTINATNPGNFQGGKEAYNTSNFAAGKIIYQSFTAPATGIYEIKFYAVTSSTSGRGFDNIYGDKIAQAYVSAGSNKFTLAMTVINQTGCTLAADANIRILSVEAAEGETIEYGLENIATGGNWYTIQNISAKMKTVAELFQAQYDEACAIWENSTENEEGARATFKTYVDALYEALTGTLAEAQAASDALAAALVIYESKSYPVKGSGVKYDFTSKMSTAINAWTCKQGNGPAQYGFTGATETYGNTAAGEVMYQTITGLANGEYEIHFYAVANAANGGGIASEASAKKVYVYANDQTLDIAVIQQNSCTPSDYECTFTVMVNDGTIKYGITNNEAAGNWYVCKNVALYMTGAPDLSDYYDAIAGKLVTANTLKGEIMNATVLSDLQEAIAATEGYESITVIGTLETMSANLTTAISNANTSVGNYVIAKTILYAASSLDQAGKDAYAADETVASIQNAYDERTLEVVTNEEGSACIVALRAAAKVQTTEGADMTLAIVNPSFETGDTTGWTYETSNDHGAKLNSNGTYTMSNCDGKYLFNIWSSGNAISQVIEGLPNGAYTLTVYVATDADHQVQINGNDKSEKIDAVDKGTGVKGEVSFIVLDNKATIGAEGVDKYWYKVDDFRLTFVRAATADDYKDGLLAVITSANSARKEANEGVGVFQVPESAGETFASAITVAQGVYDNGSATISDVTSAVETLNAAVEAYEATTLNAPDASKRYNIIVATAEHAKNGNAVVIVPGTPDDKNPTGYGMNANFAPNANLDQAVTFTQVSGNIYNISFETAEGKTYLTYGTTNGSKAGWSDSQIQATDNAENKGEFKIVASATANVFNIYNTITNSTIACQSDGTIYTESGNADFAVAEVSEASITVNTTAAGWGTLMVPFSGVEVPEGVTAYTCSAVEDNGYTLTLTPLEGETLAANTPYVIEGSWNNAFEGWGTANKTDYTEGLLTGTYVDMDAINGTYVLQKHDNKVGFYIVNTENVTPRVKANRAYLTAPAAAGANAFFFPTSGDVTAINAIEALTSGNAQVFDANGVQQQRLQKGVNIVRTQDGKTMKVMVK